MNGRHGPGLELAGKHRAIVIDNEDPEGLGRIKVRLQAAYAGSGKKQIPWAWPCFPYAGMPQEACFFVPDIGAGVWVEFMWKNGRPDTTHPIWTGCWLAKDETPEEAGGPSKAPRRKVIKTAKGHSLTFSDVDGDAFIRLCHGQTGAMIELCADGGVLIQSGDGQKIELNPTWADRRHVDRSGNGTGADDDGQGGASG